jgi:Flp pilus assembly protein TadG
VRFRTEKPKDRRWWSSGKGQSAVELAIVVPVLALMLVVVADFGRVFFVSIPVNNAARAGAQYGSQSPTNASNAGGMQLAASTDFGCVAVGSSTCPNFPNWSTPTVSQCTCASPPGSVTPCASSYCTHAPPTAEYVTVNTSATFKTILNYSYLGLASSFTLTGKAIMQVQQ